MSTETWRCLTTWDGEPGLNMGLDEALLHATEAPPTLRFYTWRPAALSLGYFQRFDDVPETRDAPAVVRRLTGGGAIEHANELTFSITCSLDHDLYRGEVRRSYERVHALLAEALARHGVEAGERGTAQLASDDGSSAMCFHRSTAIDLAWGGRKGVGSAQRRTGGRVLHHGSIKLAPSALERGVATVADGGGSTTPAGVAATIREVLQERLDVALQDGEPSAVELVRARERAPFFGSREHVRRR